MALFTFVKPILNQVQLWQKVSSQRSQLRSMSGEMLKDIGVSRAEADREANRSFWDTVRIEERFQQEKQPKALTFKYN